MLRLERGRADEAELAAVTVVLLALYAGARPCATPPVGGSADRRGPSWRRSFYRAPGGWQ
jgi:hypothetical protein